MTPEEVYAYLQAVERLGGLPVHVRVSPDDEVLSLREQVQSLTEALSGLRKEYTRAEYLYRCETVINSRLVDVCRSHGIKLEASFFSRPY